MSLAQCKTSFKFTYSLSNINKKEKRKQNKNNNNNVQTKEQENATNFKNQIFCASGASKSIVHVIKHANFQLHRT